MATGSPKSRWNNKDVDTITPDSSENISPTINLSYVGKRPEQDILNTEAAAPQILWKGINQAEEQISNCLFYGNNLPILASLLQNPLIKGNVRLVYIDPPFATNSIFQSRSQGDAYSDLLVGAKYIEFLRERLVLLRELLAEDGSIYVHLDENMAFHIKVIMDEVFGRENFRNWITRKKCNPKNYTRKTYGNISDFILFYTKTDAYVTQGTKPMGDFVTKQDPPQDNITQPPNLWDTLEEPEETHNVAIEEEFHAIRDFSLYTTENHAEALALKCLLDT